MILEVDIGNTRLKWRVREGLLILAKGFVETAEFLVLLGENIKEYRHLIGRVWVANVAGKEVADEFAAWSEDFLSQLPCFAQSLVNKGGVRNGYHEPQLLGVDRWLGMLAAYQCARKACVVVSCGTAMTIDLINKDGEHLGGFIGPGLNAMVSVLALKTKQVYLINAAAKLNLFPGRTTSDCVYSGVAAMMSGLVDNGLRELNHVEQDFELILTGGDSARLLPFYPQARFNPDLVLDGLACAMESLRAE